jgi:hypothetical protein
LGGANARAGAHMIRTISAVTTASVGGSQNTDSFAT